ncbi:MAG: MerR family transcriptional regulator [Caldilineaceae bacterium]
MNSTLDTPIYNLKAVVQETGLKPDTLRAWERRYGLPEPQRTEGGHRLYSQNDITMLKWLMARQDEGMSISRAVELWRRMQQEQGELLSNTIAPALLTPPIHLPDASNVNGHSAILSELHDAWVTSCMRFNEQQAEHVLAHAFALFSIETVCLEVIQRGLATIGEGWYKGRITVQQEHFASALAMRRLETLLTATPAPTRVGRILIGCPPEEVHVFVPLLLALLLRRKGWDILFLGANIPSQDMLLTIQIAKPALVILTAQQLYTAATLHEMAQLLNRERIPLAFGGKIFTDILPLRHRIPGYYLGDRLELVPQVVEQIMTMPRAQAAANPVQPEYRETLTLYRAAQLRIEAEIWRVMAPTDMPPEHLAKANLNFGRNIIAALTLGDMDYAGHDLAWIKGLLSNHFQIPAHLVDDYLVAYLNATQVQMETDGALIYDWLRRILRRGTGD